MDLITNPRFTLWIHDGIVVGFLAGGRAFLLSPYLDETSPLRAEFPLLWGILDEWHFRQELFTFLVRLQDTPSPDSEALEALLSQYGYI